MLQDDGTFVVVHLTWSGGTEPVGWPHTTIVQSRLAAEDALVEEHAAGYKGGKR